MSISRRRCRFLVFRFIKQPSRGTITHFFVLLIFFAAGFTLFKHVSRQRTGKNGTRSNSGGRLFSNDSDEDDDLSSGEQKPQSRVGKSGEVAFFLAPYEFFHTVDLERLHGGGAGAEFSLSFGPVVNLAQTIDESTLNEALNTLTAASLTSQHGNAKKAAKLYEHALALQPLHPQVLIEYGLFVETVRSDLLTAATLFTKALMHWPENSYAKKHFSRTLPLVEEIDCQTLRMLDQKREKFIHIPRTNAAMKRMMRESYVEHIYHTVAIEGNTMNLMQTRSILETHMAVSGKSVMEHNEILGLDAALRFINTTLIHKPTPLAASDVVEIHRRVFGYVDPIEAGRYRRTQVYVGGFVPCMPNDIEREMQEFTDWLALESTQRVHPVELAALVHYKFIIIHPFIDGNGRTARILMNLILMRAGFPPVIIKLDERARYYETLKLANDGDLRPFIRFVASCTDRALESYLTYTTEILPKFPESDRTTSVIRGDVSGGEDEL